MLNMISSLSRYCPHHPQAVWIGEYWNLLQNNVVNKNVGSIHNLRFPDLNLIKSIAWQLSCWDKISAKAETMKSQNGAQNIYFIIFILYTEIISIIFRTVKLTH